MLDLWKLAKQISLLLLDILMVLSIVTSLVLMWMAAVVSAFDWLGGGSMTFNRLPIWMSLPISVSGLVLLTRLFTGQRITHENPQQTPPTRS